MYGVYYIFTGQNSGPSIYEVITFVATLTALGVAIWQSVLAKKALQLTQKTIADDTKARQLSMLPKISDVILVRMYFDRWIEKLEKGAAKTARERDGEFLKKIAESALKSPADLRIDSFIYGKMTGALKQILMSGAQFYYNTECNIQFLFSKDAANWSFISDFLVRCRESIVALNKLYELISDLVPSIFMETPASIRNEEFLENK